MQARGVFVSLSREDEQVAALAERGDVSLFTAGVAYRF
jgi:hypothetical protein